MAVGRPESEGALDWSSEELVALVDAATSIWAGTLDDLRARPVVPGRTQADIAERLRLPIAAEPRSLDEVREFLEALVADNGLPGHPGFLAYIVGAGTVPGAVADMLGSGLMPNAGGWQFASAAHELERRLIEWFAEKVGLPRGSGGLVVGGGAIGNLIGLKLARDRRLGVGVRTGGVGGSTGHVIYASVEAHDTIARGADIVGLGSASVRPVATDDEGRMLVTELRAAVAADARDGRRPIAVVGTAGTTGTGAVDPLADIAAVAADHDLWFHVDAAYGGALALVPELRALLDGVERADSVIVDAHKWLYVAAPACLMLVRDRQHLADSFAVSPDYVFEDADRTGQGTSSAFISPTFSRAFDALKVIVSLLAHGTDAYERRIRHDIELTRYLAARVEELPELELVRPPSLSVCCFRYRPPDRAGEYLDALNEQLLIELQLDGRVFPSSAIVDGRFALRSCIVNFRTEAAELDVLLEETLRLGRELDARLVGELA